jgi:hypothetical protein
MLFALSQRRIKMSIVRVGLGETEKFGEGYEAIFGRKRPAAKKKKSPAKRTVTAKKKKTRKK